MLEFTFEWEGVTWVLTPMLRLAVVRPKSEEGQPIVLRAEEGKLQQYCYNKQHPETGKWFDVQQEVIYE